MFTLAGRGNSGGLTWGSSERPGPTADGSEPVPSMRAGGYGRRYGGVAGQPSTSANGGG